MRHSLVLLAFLSILSLGCKKGTSGKNGADGTDGTNGANGSNGKNSLIDFVTEPAGANCANGGYKVLSGIDQNENGVLDASEVQVTKYLCNGSGGSGSNGRNSLISFVTENAGANCASGGYKVMSGLDANGNNVLDDSEVQSTKYICNGDEGRVSLVAVIDEPAGGNCASGGFRINSGLDNNRNNVLDNNEVQNTKYICNAAGGTGTNGFNSLVSVVAEPIGTNCAGGGNRINYGMDLNRNNVLDNNEISSTTFMCNANRVYAAVVSQSGTSAPLGVPIINNLDVTVTWTRIGVGRYTGVISKSMNLLKTIVLSNNTNVTTNLTSPTTISLESNCSAGVFCDGFVNVTVGLLVVD